MKVNGKKIAWLVILVMAAAGTVVMADELTTDKVLFQQHLLMASALAVLIVGGIFWFERWYSNKFPPDIN